jgi:hypothetical protein
VDRRSENQISCDLLRTLGRYWPSKRMKNERNAWRGGVNGTIERELEIFATASPFGNRAAESEGDNTSCDQANEHDDDLDCK